MLKIITLILISYIALANDTSVTDPSPISDAMCIILQLIQGSLAKTVGVIGVVALGIGLFLGRTNWGVALSVMMAVALIFGSGSVINWLTGQNISLACTVESAGSGSSGTGPIYGDDGTTYITNPTIPEITNPDKILDDSNDAVRIAEDDLALLEEFASEGDTANANLKLFDIANNKARAATRYQEASELLDSAFNEYYDIVAKGDSTTEIDKKVDQLLYQLFKTQFNYDRISETYEAAKEVTNNLTPTKDIDASNALKQRAFNRNSEAENIGQDALNTADETFTKYNAHKVLNDGHDDALSLINRYTVSAANHANIAESSNIHSSNPNVIQVSKSVNGISQVHLDAVRKYEALVNAALHEDNNSAEKRAELLDLAQSVKDDQLGNIQTEYRRAEEMLNEFNLSTIDKSISELIQSKIDNTNRNNTIISQVMAETNKKLENAIDSSKENSIINDIRAPLKGGAQEIINGIFQNLGGQ